MAMISGCVSQPTVPAHPDLDIPLDPELPFFTREMLDCGQHNPDMLPLCLRIKERETLLQDYIDTLIILIEQHNEMLD